MVNINKINAILSKNSESILSAQSFSERMERVYEILDSEFPKTTLASAVFGPITDMEDFMERTEIDQLLQIIRQSASAGQEYCATDPKYNSVLMLIYDFIKKHE